MSLRLHHPLFGMSPLGDYWDVAGAPDAPVDDRVNALYVLSQHRDKLPGLVFFVVPDGVEGNEKWLSIISASKPYCKCRSRRALHPTRGRSQFISATVPRKVVLSYVDRELGDGACMTTDSPPLFITPHGGDQASAYVQWLLSGGHVVARQLPYMTNNDPNYTRLIYNQAGIAHDTDRWRMRRMQADRVDWAAESYGGLTFMQAISTPGQRRMWVPTCMIHGVSHERRFSKPDQTYVHMEIDASVDVIKPDESLPQHVCANDIDKQS